MQEQIAYAVEVLNRGGVIAYPTESCFGLGCDPQNQAALKKLLVIKNRSVEQGFILIASELEQIEQYADLQASPMLSRIRESWPGFRTWLLPTRIDVSDCLRGKHQTIAMRLTDNDVCKQLCQLFGGAIVSTSANRHGQSALMTAADVSREMGTEIDFVFDAAVGGATQASSIYDGITGKQIR